MLSRESLERAEREELAPYAAFSDATQGRDHAAEPCTMRTEFQRDRDRIIHSAAFRKLEHKTQVYVIHEGDYYRTRLTHTMEVAQIARSLARSLRLNTDLAEAVALAHDLGHTPFAHAGERALNQLLSESGGRFEHNLQGLRVVELLERRYLEHPGLNLTWEVREGIAKHRTSYDDGQSDRFDPEMAPPLEGQLADLADEIAYNHHDLDDALEMGLLHRADLERIPWVHALCQRLEEEQSELRRSVPGSPAINPFLRHRLVARLIDISVRDALEHSESQIAESGVGSIEDVRRAGRRLIAFSPEVAERNARLRTFLMENVYQHPHVVHMTTRAERFVEELFRVYERKPGLLPVAQQERIGAEGLEQVLVDYISGMTDRYCMEEYRRIFLP